MFPCLDKYDNEQFLDYCDKQVAQFKNEFIDELNTDY
jgi:hypothetical protein